MNPTREIMWNVSTLPNVVALYGLLFFSISICGNGLYQRFRVWQSGKSAPEYWGAWLIRIDDVIQNGLFQRGVSRGKSGAALAHLLIYLGFLVLLFTTTMVFIHHDLGIEIYQGRFYLIVTMFSDVFGILLLVGCLCFAHRRLIEKADASHTFLE